MFGFRSAAVAQCSLIKMTGTARSDYPGELTAPLFNPVKVSVKCGGCCALVTCALNTICVLKLKSC